MQHLCEYRLHIVSWGPVHDHVGELRLHGLCGRIFLKPGRLYVHGLPRGPVCNHDGQFCLHQMLGRLLLDDARPDCIELYGLFCGPVPDDDGRVGVDELHRLHDGAVLVGDRPGDRLPGVRCWSVRLEHGQHGVRRMRCGAVCRYNGNDNVHGMRCGSILEHNERDGYDGVR